MERVAKMPKIIKDFYEEDPEVTNMTKEYVDNLRKINNDIEVKHIFDEDETCNQLYKIPNPIETFEQAFRVIRIK